MTSGQNRIPHDNNFDLLRLVFAIVVVYSHCFLLSAPREYPETLQTFAHVQAKLGGISVNGFFVVSGFLITRSYFNSRTSGEFIIKRLLRIYPGYFAAIGFSLLIAMAGAYPAHLFYLRHTLLSYNSQLFESLLLPDSSFLERDYLFSGNPFPRSVNASVWTLRPELCCYLFVLVFGLFGWLQRRGMILTVTIGSLVCYYLNSTLLGRTSDAVWRLASFFLVGTCFALNHERTPKMTLIKLVVCLILLTIAVRLTNAFNIAFAVIGGYCIISIGNMKTLPGTSFVTRADLSYGIYLYSFPVQQLIVSWYPLVHPYALFFVTMPIVLLLAAMSWRYIESPAMKWRHKIAPHMK